MLFSKDVYIKQQMRITSTSIFVEDQGRALKFYTEVLGFNLKADRPANAHQEIRLTSADNPDGTQLLLEPINFAPARIYQLALFEENMPIASFEVDDIEQEYIRLTQADVRFIQEPTISNNIKTAVFDDTCGNYIQIFQL